MSDDLSIAKQKLLDKLGSNYGLYIQLLGKWFRGIISKEEFDRNAKKLIEQNFVLEHNKFWLAFFHHCANNAATSIQSHNFQLDDPTSKLFNKNSIDSEYDNRSGVDSNSASTQNRPDCVPRTGKKVRCLPSKVITHMKIFVISWELGLDSVSDSVSNYINLALEHFLKNIITELICTKTAYRMRENRFKYAMGVKPMNPYLNNSLKIYSSNLEYDPYQIESNKMNSSLVDTHAYNDSLFPSRLYEAQALYEYACSTTDVTSSPVKRAKRLKFSEIFLSDDKDSADKDSRDFIKTNGFTDEQMDRLMDVERGELLEMGMNDKETEDLKDDIEKANLVKSNEDNQGRRLTLFHLLMAFLSNRTIVPPHKLYSLNIERIFTKLSC